MARTPDVDREREAGEADHGVHRRGDDAGRRSRAPLPLHGTQGDRERRHPLHQREGAAREHSLGRGQGAQARAHHAQHRPAHDSRRAAPGGGKAMLQVIAQVGERARAVGTADRQARGRRAEDRDDGGEHLRDGSVAELATALYERGRLRHPARGGDREDVQHRSRLAHRRRHAADPRRARLRDGGFAARAAASCRFRSSARCATSAST